MIQSKKHKRKHKIIIWRFKDGKPGHEKQTDAFTKLLSDEIPIKTVDIHITRRPWFYLYQAIKIKTNQKASVNMPDILVGTGHKTHLPILLYKFILGIKAIVIMKPSLPIRFFDLVIAPQHDFKAAAKPDNVVLTPIPIAERIKSNQNKNQGLILLGGKSAHYDWDDKLIAGRLKNLIISKPNIDQWLITTSRRTPETFIEALATVTQNFTHVNVFLHTEVGKNWLGDQLKTSEQIWVTRDSASMIAEALLTDADVGLIEITPQNKYGKIERMLENLAQENHLLLEKDVQTRNKRKPINFQPAITASLALLET